MITLAWNWVFTLLGGWKGVVMAGMLFAALTMLAGYVYEYDRRGRQLVEYKLINSQLGNEIKVHEANIRLVSKSLDTLDKELRDRIEDYEIVCKALGSVDKDNTPGADDKVHGTIGNILETLRNKKDDKR